MSKKIIVIIIMCVLVATGSLFADKRSDMWQKAITEKDPNLKYQYLQQYETEFGGKKDKLARYLYLNLCDTAFKLKKWDESIQYGEKALTFEEIEINNKIRVFTYLANAYRITKKDVEKAYHFASQTADLAQETITNTEKSSQDEASKKKNIDYYSHYYLAPSYRLQALILYDKDKNNVQNLKEATAKASEAYKIDKSANSAKMVAGMAMNLSKKRANQEAINALELIIDKSKPEYNYVNLLANLYVRLKKMDKAAEYFELAYKAKRKPSLAQKIGQLVQKTNMEKGLRYLAEAYVLQDMDNTTEAYRYLQHLYFNEYAKGKTAEEKEKGFLALINAARQRLGKAPVQSLKPAEGTTEG